jgi:hypothetical protein
LGDNWVGESDRSRVDAQSAADAAADGLHLVSDELFGRTSSSYKSARKLINPRGESNALFARLMIPFLFLVASPPVFLVPTSECLALFGVLP